MSKDIVQRIEASMQADRVHIELDKALERLETNRDFKLVIAEGYLEKEAVRLVHVKADPAMQTPERKANIDRDIAAIGSFLQYLRTVSHNAAVAVKSIQSSEQALEELHAEEMTNG
jgi:hypothetical protein